MRSYSQYCSIARALDLVGERWTLLIARELMLRGPSRFTDLKNGLPGIAPNLLASRLRELEEAGLISRTEAPPPVATALYALTPAGQALEPVLSSLREWGLQFMAEERQDDSFRAHWLAGAAASFIENSALSHKPLTIQLRSANEAAFVEVGEDGHVRAKVGVAPRSDLVLEGSPRSILGLLGGMVDLRTATDMGLEVTGDRKILKGLVRTRH